MFLNRSNKLNTSCPLVQSSMGRRISGIHSSYYKYVISLVCICAAFHHDCQPTFIGLGLRFFQSSTGLAMSVSWFSGFYCGQSKPKIGRRLEWGGKGCKFIWPSLRTDFIVFCQCRKAYLSHCSCFLVERAVLASF